MNTLFARFLRFAVSPYQGIICAQVMYKHIPFQFTGSSWCYLLFATCQNQFFPCGTHIDLAIFAGYYDMNDDRDTTTFATYTSQTNASPIIERSFRQLL